MTSSSSSTTTTLPLVRSQSYVATTTTTTTRSSERASSSLLSSSTTGGDRHPNQRLPLTVPDLGSNEHQQSMTTTATIRQRPFDSNVNNSKVSSMVKKGVKSASFLIQRVSDKLDASPTLPHRSTESSSSSNRLLQHSPILKKASTTNSFLSLRSSNNSLNGGGSSSVNTTKTTRSSYRAAERGRGDLLPTTTTTKKAVTSPPVNTSSKGNGAFANSRNNHHRPSMRSSSGGSGGNHPAATRRSNTFDSSNGSMPYGKPITLRSRRRSKGHSNHAAAAEEESAPMSDYSGGRFPTYGTGMRSSSSNNQMIHHHHQQQQHSRSESFTKLMKRQSTTSPTQDIFCGQMPNSQMHLYMKRSQLFQAIVLLVVTFFVWESYYKAVSTTEELLIVKHEESMMLLHLKRLEEQSLHLHESINRLSEGGGILLNKASSEQGGGKTATASTGGASSVDSDLIKVQIGQLQQMEDELTNEVRSLQAKIQHTDRANVVRTFGEGPVQVNVELDFHGQQVVASSHSASNDGDNGNNLISILLWYDTPHAAWTLLDQVRRGHWDGASFGMDKNAALVASPLFTAASAGAAGKLDFVEKGQKKHEAWTIGLTENAHGTLDLFINLQDNSKLYRHDVCVGKVIDGFDALQALTRSVRSNHRGNNNNKPITIKRATASHLTRRESAGLM